DRLSRHGDEVQLKVFEAVGKVDINGDHLINGEDISDAAEIFQKYVDVDGDGDVDADDIQRLKVIAYAMTLLVTQTQIDKYDFDASGKIEQDELKILEDAINNFYLVDINKDTRVDDTDVSRLKAILELVYHQQAIGAGTIAKKDLNYDGKIDSKDVRLYLQQLNSLVDADGDGVIDETAMNQLVNDIKKVRVLDIEQESLENADLNGDGNVDLADITVFLGSLDQNVFMDLNHDQKFDQTDISIAKNFINIVNQEVTFSAAEMERADLNGDGFVNAEDMELIAGYVDVDASGSVDQHDLALIRDYAYRSKADLNGDGKIDAKDKDALKIFLGGQSIRMDAANTYSRVNAERVGTTLVTPIRSNSLMYRVDFAKDGVYDLGLAVKSYDRELPEGYKYKFAVYVDGEYKGDFEVDGSHLDYQKNSYRIELPKGAHFVEFKSVPPANPAEQGYKVQI
ncbi:MAG: hypothetical protein COW13_01415, partial [Candidatus Omnitrophica bacterium CG12_big_fil_rev_8_21_14_0_65_50_5]